MTLSSYSDVFSIEHERGYEEEIRVGDTVRCGPNHHPHYEVIALHGEKAWLRNIQNGADALAPITRCRRLDEATLRAAAE
ncbi:hypothetical protein [Phenylobacterium sp.]|jgi:hypothetical protein|uniref:hypothetical protein n=1 Tax=Phenylobacterium sp. TaxID=1871053 RepID=UPI00378372C7